MPFDPLGWAARFIPESRLHRAVQAGGVSLFAAFGVLRVQQYGDFLLKPLWAVETLVYVVLAAAFCLRPVPLDRSRGLREVALPAVGALLPFGLLTSPPNPFVLARPWLLLGIFWWMTGATALTVWGIWTLRRSFSITVEARSLVTGGPYRWVRHPIYLGELLTAAAVFAWRSSVANAALFASLVVAQLARAHVEEEKLGRNFPEYRKLAEDSWWFW